MNNDEYEHKPHAGLIKENLRRSYEDKAKEELPANLLALIEQLREQDDKNGK